MPDSSGDGVIRAAGAVVWRPGALGPDIALVHRPRYDDWSYPKGKCHRDEHVLAAAYREVMEETGLRVILGRPLMPSVYQAGGRPKRVSYWAARCVESVGFVPNHEVDQVSWLPADAARERLTYPRDVTLLDEFRSGPARSVPLILLRHAAAGRKPARGGVSDLARPLDARGSADAELLAGLLASYGQCRVISSAAERCVATVRPYAAAVGVPVEVEPAFMVPSAAMTDSDPLMAGVGQAATAGGRVARSDRKKAASSHLAAQARDVSRRAAQRASTVAASGVPTLICAHRENLPVLIEVAFAALGGSLPDSRPLHKASFWALQSAGGVLVSAERHDLAE